MMDMPMRRAALLFLTDLDAPRFNLLRQRDQLPFACVGDSKWAEFSLDDAFKLRLMLDLIEDAGQGAKPPPLSPTFAPKMVVNGFAAEPLTIADAAATSPSIWIAHAGFEGITADDETHHSASHFCGPLADLDGWIAGIIAKDGDGYRTFACKRLFMANATRAANFVLERAQELGLPEADAWA